MISRQQFAFLLERHGPATFFVAGLLAGCFLSIPEEKLFLSTLATVGALLSSLTGVSISGFLSLKTDIAEALRERGFYKRLMRYAQQSVMLSLLMACTAIVGFFVSSACGYGHVYPPILWGVSLSAFVAFFRVFRLLIQIGGFYREPREET